MEPFKNKISEPVVFQVGDLVRGVWPEFPTRRYRAQVRGQLEPLELKARGQWVGDALWSVLPGPPKRNFEILSAAVKGLPMLGGPDGLDSWAMFPLDQVLGAHGPKSFVPAMKFAKEVTQRFTAEFGIRSLLLAEPERCLRVLLEWTQSDSQHVRRLASEGTRPRLPWGQRLPFLIEDPRPTRPILEALRDDPEEYVRRSVANHWNDIAKDHPEYVVQALSTWHADGDKPRQKLVRHGLRTLIKAGHRDALQILGYAPARLSLAELRLRPKTLTLGQPLQAQVELHSSQSTPQDLIVDFRFHFVKANGQTSPKVFKGKGLTLPARGHVTFTQRFPLQPVTTRRYYPGPTRVEILVNGEVHSEAQFLLRVP